MCGPVITPPSGPPGMSGPKGYRRSRLDIPTRTVALLRASAAIETTTPRNGADRLPKVWRKRGGLPVAAAGLDDAQTRQPGGRQDPGNNYVWINVPASSTSPPPYRGLQRVPELRRPQLEPNQHRPRPPGAADLRPAATPAPQHQEPSRGARYPAQVDITSLADIVAALDGVEVAAHLQAGPLPALRRPGEDPDQRAKASAKTSAGHNRCAFEIEAVNLEKPAA